MRKKLFIIFPLIIWAFLCLSEWYMWMNPPYAFFFSRGHDAPNTDYVAITRGDLTAENIFVTPVPRECRYVTDKYGTRNEYDTDVADFLIVGDSFAWGAGNSHEDTPAVQLAELTGKTVMLAPASRYEKVKGVTGFEKMARMIKSQEPIKFKTILYFIVDGDLLEGSWDFDPSIKVKEVINQNKAPNKLTPMEKFKAMKQHIMDYSPHAIIGRKIKSWCKVRLHRLLFRFNVVKKSSRTLDYLDHNGITYGFMKIKGLDDSNEKRKKLNQMVNGLVMLKSYGRSRNVNIVPVIIPRKKFAYNRYIDTPQRIIGYGPGEILYRRLNEEGMDAVFLHPALFKAVEGHIEKGRLPAYWSDDTHWSPYGIGLAMEEVKKKLKQMNLL